MKSLLISIPVFFILLFFESTIIPFPLVFLFSVVLFLLKKNIQMFFLIFIFSLFIDSLRLSPIGFTALFLFSLFCLSMFLERIFAAEGLWLGTILSVVALEVYRHTASYPFSFILFSVVLAGATFIMYVDFKKQNESKVL